MSEEKTGNQNTPDDQERGLRYVLYDGMMFQAMGGYSGETCHPFWLKVVH